MLHIVNKSPYERNSLTSCLAHTGKGSALILIEDAVYAATRDLCGVAETSDPGLSARRMSVLIRARHGRPRTR